MHMDMQWIPYSDTKDCWTDFEILYHDTQRENGYSIIDIYRFIEYIILVYGKIYSFIYSTPLEKIVREIYNKNSKFFEETFRQDVYCNKEYFTNNDVEKIFQNFQVPRVSRTN